MSNQGGDMSQQSPNIKSSYPEKKYTFPFLNSLFAPLNRYSAASQDFVNAILMIDIVGARKAVEQGANVNLKIIDRNAYDQPLSPLILMATKSIRSHNSIPLAIFLLDKGCNPRTQVSFYDTSNALHILLMKFSALSLDCSKGRTLIEKIIQTDPRILRDRTSTGHTAFHLAIKYGQIQALNIIFQYKKYLNTNLKDNEGKTALMLAIEKDDTQAFGIFNLLMNQKDINIHLCDKDGNTALHYTALAQNDNARLFAKKLIEAGAKTGTLNKAQETCLSLAKKVNNKTLIEFFEKETYLEIQKERVQKAIMEQECCPILSIPLPSETVAIIYNDPSLTLYSKKGIVAWAETCTPKKAKNPIVSNHQFSKDDIISFSYDLFSNQSKSHMSPVASKSS